MFPVIPYNHEIVKTALKIDCMYCTALLPATKQKERCCITDMIKHLYKHHRAPFFSCTDCDTKITNTVKSVTLHDNAHTFTCEPCNTHCTGTRDAALHLQEHLKRDSAAMQEQTPVDFNIDVCVFCTAQVTDKITDYTKCCKIPLHFECAFMWAVQDLNANQTERCMHCRAPNIMLSRLQEKFNDFNWPAHWLRKQPAGEMDSATLDAVNGMYGDDIIITSEHRVTRSTAVPAMSFTSERYRRNVRSRREENLQRIVDELITERDRTRRFRRLRFNLPSAIGN